MKVSRALISLCALSALFLVVAPVEAAGPCGGGMYKDTAYKAANTPVVYYVTEDCTKRPFKKSKDYFTYFSSWSEVKTVSQAALDAIPNDALNFMPAGPKYDPQYGALVKSVKDPKVYFLLGGKRYWVKSEYHFERLGYKWEWVEDVDQRLIDKYPLGEELNYWDGQPNYTIIKYENDPKVYRLEPHPEDASKTVKRHIKDEAVFTQLGFRMDRIVEINSCDWNDFDCVRVTDSLADAIDGEDIRVPSDVRTPVQEVTVVPKVSSVPEFTLYKEPVYDFEYVLPDTWVEPRTYTYGSGDSKVYTINASSPDYSTNFIASVAKNTLTLDPEVRRELLLLTFDVDYGSMSEQEIERHFKKVEKRLLDIYDVDSIEDMSKEDQEAIGNVLLSVGVYQVFLGSGKREVNFETIAGYRDIFHLTLTSEETEYGKAKQYDMYMLFMGSKLYSFTTAYEVDAPQEVKDQVVTMVKNLKIVK